jgi:TPR repeat protein
LFEGAISMGMAFVDAMAAYDRGDYAGAARVWQSLAEFGDARAQSNLGVMYAKGRGVRQDSSTAAHWYRKAAAQGNSNAQCNLALMYAEGRGVPQDPGAAAAWYQKAAAQGHGRAQYNLGIMYLEGHGFLPDYDAAAAWFRKAAEQGVTGAKRKAEEANQRARQREQRQQEQARRAAQPRCDCALDGPEWWVVLGTDAEASMEIAKQAYRLKMKQYHPDRTLGLAPELIQMAEKKARELNSAMEQAERHHRSRAEHHPRARF